MLWLQAVTLCHCIKASLQRCQWHVAAAIKLDFECEARLPNWAKQFWCQGPGACCGGTGCGGATNQHNKTSNRLRDVVTQVVDSLQGYWSLCKVRGYSMRNGRGKLSVRATSACNCQVSVGGHPQVRRLEAVHVLRLRKTIQPQLQLLRTGATVADVLGWTACRLCTCCASV